jgi:hypothetical protein
MMSARMRNWIGPLVERVLAAKSPNSDAESDKLILHLTEDNSIQINEVRHSLLFYQGLSDCKQFISHFPECAVWVSDSFTRLRAVFTKKATDAFQKKYKRPFRKGTLGAVIGITDYFLVWPLS